MSENTTIEWADHTFNPWEGCQKVGLGCDHCYAETRNARFGGGTAVNWGPGAPRRRTSAANWRKPLAWNAAHAEFYAAHDHRQRVFCASLADVFDNAVDPTWRADLADLIQATPNLDWLLLTKRIGNAGDMLGEMFLDGVPDNVLLGATIVNQEEAERDIPKLLRVAVERRFLSMEPLLGPVSFQGLFANPDNIRDCTNMLEAMDWVIVGGESGPGARPMHPVWARELRDQCATTSVPFLFKQWGEWAPAQDGRSILGKTLTLQGAAPFTDQPLWHRFEDGQHMAKIGKRAAGRELDGHTYNGFPEAI
jgi:protein gp37